MLERAAENTPGMSRVRTTPDASSSVGRWKQDLSLDVQELCAEMMGDVLAEFGYET
jgi:hypothetical protein